MPLVRDRQCFSKISRIDAIHNQRTLSKVMHSIVRNLKLTTLCLEGVCYTVAGYINH